MVDLSLSSSEKSHFATLHPRTTICCALPASKSHGFKKIILCKIVCSTYYRLNNERAFIPYSEQKN
jgi:hypothetical protein